MTTVAHPELGPPRHILVNGERIKLRIVQNSVWLVICAAIGAYMITALYYLLFQVRYGPVYLKPGWDGLIKRGWWTPGRHDYRNCYEAVFAILFVRSIFTKAKTWNDRVGWFRLATAPLVLFLAAFPIITLGIYLIDVHSWGHTALPAWLITYQAVIIGAVASHAVRPLFTPVGNTVQLFFLDQALASGHAPQWPLPPTLRERYAWMKQTGAKTKDYGAWFTVLVVIMILALLGLAVFGAYVHFFIAKGIHLL